MALSNAERQARYRQRLKEQARGMTPELMRRAIRIWFEASVSDDPDPITWEEYLTRCNRKGGGKLWLDNIDMAFPKEDFEDYGEHAELLRNARAIIDAVLAPPR